MREREEETPGKSKKNRRRKREQLHQSLRMGKSKWLACKAIVTWIHWAEGNCHTDALARQKEKKGGQTFDRGDEN